MTEPPAVEPRRWPRVEWARPMSQGEARGRSPFEHLCEAARQGRHPRVVSVQSPGAGPGRGSILEVSLDLGEVEPVDIQVAAGDPMTNDERAASDLPVMLAGTQTLSEGFLELKTDDFRVVLCIDNNAAELLAREVHQLYPTGHRSPMGVDTLTELLLNSHVIEAAPLAPDGYVHDRSSGLFLPDDLPGATIEPVVLPGLTEFRRQLEPRDRLAPVATVQAGKRRQGASWPTLCFWFAVVGAALFRYLVLASASAPPTIDAGNWLAFAEGIFGGGERASSIAYPPVVPFFTGVLVALLGTTHGVAVMGALSSLAPSLGLYKALSMAGLGRERIVPSLLLLGAGSVGEAAAWGGFPQLLAMGVLPIAIVAGMRAFDEPSRARGFLLGLAVMVSLAISHFVSVVLVAALGLLLISAAVRHRNRQWFDGMAAQLPLIVLPSIWLAPTYLRLLDAVVVSPNEFAALDNLTADNALGRLDNVYADFPTLWQVLVPLAVITPILAWPMRRTMVWRLGTLLALCTGLLLVGTQEARYLYLVPLVAAAALGVWLVQLANAPLWHAPGQRAAAFRIGAIALANLVGALQLHAGLSQFERQRDFYAVLSPGLVEAIDVADDLADGDDVIAVPSLDDAPIGWWVEGLTDAHVMYGTPLRWLNFSDEIERATIANAVFDPSFPDATTLSQLDDASIDVVIVPRTWAWYDDALIEEWVDDNGLEIVERNADALTIDVR